MVARNLPPEQAPQKRQIRIEVLPVGDVLEPQPLQLRLWVAGYLAEGGVDAGEPPVQVDEGHADRRLVDGEPKPFLGFAQLPIGGLRLLAGQLFPTQELLSLAGRLARLGYVARKGLPTTSRKDVRAQVDRDQRAVLPSQPPFPSFHPSGHHQRRARRRQARQVLGRKKVRDCLDEQLLTFEPEHPTGALVDVREVTVQVGQEERVGRQLDRDRAAGRPGFPRIGGPGPPSAKDKRRRARRR